MQVPYKVGDAGSLGKGLFAAADIPRGTLLWKYEVGKSVKEYTKDTFLARLKGCTEAEIKDVLGHVYCWEGKVIEILDDGLLWNHSKNPNTGDCPEDIGDGDPFSSYAIRDIKKGEQLLDDYGSYDRLKWFEKLCSKFGVVHFDEGWE